ncbi:TonB-dependent siderophore receptor [Pseudorhodoferax sp.]|uniref:TonB-dependent siderophore receptor n=1 Tax=Pseudorhodoferax sp. TaxID=1993553 RepID=UPI002DD6598D|nr:TonB-dependent siderophore receptor [Pseudorhodoferax sp.]
MFLHSIHPPSARRALCIAVLAVCGSAPALAQSSATLKEVTVTEGHDATTEGTRSYTTTAPVSTATKLGLTPRETPQSMTIITRERMEEQGLQTLSETLQQVTGVYVSNNDTERVTYSARGYNINNYQVDGMLNTFGGSLKTNGDNVVYDRVEVVRGATGLMTGAGDPSATVNQVRKRPTTVFQGSAALRLGTYDLHRVEVDLSGPLAFDGKLRGRVAAAKQESGSFRPLYEQDIGAVYGIVEADLGPATTVALGYERQRSDPRGITWGTVLQWNRDGSLANLPYDLNLSAPWSSWTIDEKKTFATLEHRFGPDWRARAAVSHSNRVQDGYLFFGFGPYGPYADGSGGGIGVTSGRFPSDEDMDVVDLNVDGKFQAFGRTHEVLLGWGQSKKELDSLRVQNITPSTGYTLIPDWRTWTGDVPRFTSIDLPVPTSINVIRQKAGYLATRLHLADPLKAVLGVRYSEYETRTDNFNASGAVTSRSGYKNDGVWTPYAGLLFDLTPQWTAYTAYTSIFQPQNYRDKDNQPLDPMEGNSLEAGIKGELFDKRLNVSAAVFRSKRDNVAEIDDSVPPNSLPGAVQAYRSTGKGNTVDGVEFEAAGQVTRQWNLAVGYSHTRSRLANGDPTNTGTPRNLFKLFTSYRFGEGQRFSIGGGLNFQSSFWAAAQRPTGAYAANGNPILAASRIEQDSVWLASLMLGWRINEHFSAQLNVNNLFDKHYANRVGFYNGVHYADPRTAMVTLRATF